LPSCEVLEDRGQPFVNLPARKRGARKADALRRWCGPRRDNPAIGNQKINAWCVALNQKETTAHAQRLPALAIGETDPPVRAATDMWKICCSLSIRLHKLLTIKQHFERLLHGNPVFALQLDGVG
jgi:hypothetical protein